MKEEETKEFKVGDKVVVDDYTGRFRKYNGKVGKILTMTKPYYKGVRAYLIRYGDEGGIWNQKPMRLIEDNDTEIVMEDADIFSFSNIAVLPKRFFLSKEFIKDHFTTNSCKHPNKYLNSGALTQRFYYCPDCKGDWDYEKK